MTVYIRTYDRRSQATGPLSGLTFSVKDIFCVKGYPCSWGIVPEYMRTATDTALLIEQCEQKGATLLGATNLSPLSLNISPKNIFFGDAKEVSVLGSSFGAALSVIAKGASRADFAFGSDSGGSIRAPAASVNVIGFKGTSTLFSRKDVCLLDTSLDAIGVIATDFNVLTKVLDHCTLSKEQQTGAFTKIFLPHRDDLLRYASHMQSALQHIAERIAPSYELPKGFFDSAQRYRRAILSKLYRALSCNDVVKSVKENLPQLRALSRYAEITNATKDMDEFNAMRSYVSVEQDTLFLHPTLSEQEEHRNIFLPLANVLDLYSLSFPVKNGDSWCLSSAANSNALISTAQSLLT